MTARPQNHPMLLLSDEILRLNGRLKSVFAGSGAATGLPAMESTVLAAVVQARTPPTVPQIGRSLGHPRQVMQRAANALIATGLIKTAANPDHKRAPLLVATAAGEALKQEADARAIQAADALLQVVDEAKCQRLIEELRELRAEIEHHLRSKGTDHGSHAQTRRPDERAPADGVARSQPS